MIPASGGTSASAQNLQAELATIVGALTSRMVVRTAVASAYRDEEFRCTECLRAWTKAEAPQHSEICVVGIGGRLLASVREQTPVKLDLDSVPQAEVDAMVASRHGAESGEPGTGERGYHEPWTLATAEHPSHADLPGAVITVCDEVIAAGVGTTVPQEEEARYMERIVACVNFCEGMTNAELRAAEEAASRVLTKVLREEVLR